MKVRQETDGSKICFIIYMKIIFQVFIRFGLILASCEMVRFFKHLYAVKSSNNS